MTAFSALWLLVFSVAGIASLGIALRFLGFSRSLMVVPILWGATIWLLTEGLSALDFLRPLPIAAFWLLATTALVIFALRLRVTHELSRVLQAGWVAFRRLRTPFRVVGYVVVVVWLIALTLAIVSPPNNWDSMTYHLPRVMQWIQNGSVEHFATGNARQLVQPPLSSYAALQSIITTRQDYLVNLIQWISGVWCLVVIACIAKRMKASNEAAMLAVFFAASIPIGIAESTTTQNEWLMSLWVLLTCFVWLSYVQRRVTYKFVIFASGGLLFCAAATKQLSLFYAAVFFIALLVSVGYRCGVRRAAIVAAAGSFGAAATLTPQFVRNYVTFGSFAGDPLILQILSDLRAGSERSVPANLVVHGLFNIPVPSSLPVEQIGDFLGAPFGQTTRSFFSLWGLDRYLPFPGIQFQEDSAASPVTFFLGLAALGWFFWRFRGVVPRTYALGVMSLFAIVLFSFSANIGTNRYLLPAMLLASVPLAMWLIAMGPKVLVPVVALTGIYACIFVLVLEYRPILPNFAVFTAPREDLYFTARPELLAPYRDFADALKASDPGRQQVIGLVQGYDDFEYPLWVLARAPWQAHIVHVGVLPSGERVDPSKGLEGADVVFDTLSTPIPRPERRD